MSWHCDERLFKDHNMVTDGNSERGKNVRVREREKVERRDRKMKGRD
jgi:hypothetical protein